MVDQLSSSLFAFVFMNVVSNCSKSTYFSVSNLMIIPGSKVVVVDKLTVTFLVDNCIEWCVAH